MAGTGSRNDCLDLLKGVACIFVIFMHCEFPGYLGVFMQCISRFCVPFFFMVSGYYCFREDGGAVNFGRKIRHIAGIVLAASLFYLVVTPLWQTGFPAVSWEWIRNWIAFNSPVYIAGQLWFLFALLYDYIGIALVEKLKLRRLAYAAIPIGIAVYIVMAQGMHLLGYSVLNMYYRNFLVEGFPLFMLGFWIHEHQDQIRISNRTLLLVLAIATALCPVERLLMGRDFGVNIVTFPQVTALFLLGVRNPSFGEGSALAKFGKELSLFIYVLHPAVWHLLEKGYAAAGLDGNTAALYLMPVLVLVLTFVLACAAAQGKSLAEARMHARE